jgi:hypothetical protein
VSTGTRGSHRRDAAGAQVRPWKRLNQFDRRPVRVSSCRPLGDEPPILELAIEPLDCPWIHHSPLISNTKVTQHHHSTSEPAAHPCLKIAGPAGRLYVINSHHDNQPGRVGFRCTPASEPIQQEDKAMFALASSRWLPAVDRVRDFRDILPYFIYANTIAFCSVKRSNRDRFPVATNKMLMHS